MLWRSRAFVCGPVAKRRYFAQSTPYETFFRRGFARKKMLERFAYLSQSNAKGRLLAAGTW